MTDLETFTQAYIECALWSSTYTDAEGDESFLNDSRHELSDECRSLMTADCWEFYSSYNTYIEQGLGAARAGHDFWLTRCGHGAGFWDGDWPEPTATILTAACKAYPNVDLYVGDDGQIYGG